MVGAYGWEGGGIPRPDRGESERVGQREVYGTGPVRIGEGVVGVCARHIEEGEAWVGSWGEIGGGFSLLDGRENTEEIGRRVVDVEFATDQICEFKIKDGRRWGD